MSSEGGAGQRGIRGGSAGRRRGIRGEEGRSAEKGVAEMRSRGRGSG